MALPDREKERVTRVLSTFCEERVPAELRAQVNYSFKIRGKSVTLHENRPAFRSPGTWVAIPVAQFRYDPDRSRWWLYCADRNGRWHAFEGARGRHVASREIKSLLDEVVRDSTGIFFG